MLSVKKGCWEEGHRAHSLNTESYGGRSEGERQEQRIVLKQQRADFVDRSQILFKIWVTDIEGIFYQCVKF